MQRTLLFCADLYKHSRLSSRSPINPRQKSTGQTFKSRYFGHAKCKHKDMLTLRSKSTHTSQDLGTNSPPCPLAKGTYGAFALGILLPEMMYRFCCLYRNSVLDLRPPLFMMSMSLCPRGPVPCRAFKAALFLRRPCTSVSHVSGPAIHLGLPSSNSCHATVAPEAAMLTLQATTAATVLGSHASMGQPCTCACPAPGATMCM
eukprot:1145482-Pelagomonas_calceolata.AAC.1